jgi:lipoprotein-anchoring transpeptidase ErfK/SrfK
LRHLPLAMVLVVACVVAVDPRPFDSPPGTPTVALASEPLITGATATTIPPTVTIAPTDPSAPPSTLPAQAPADPVTTTTALPAPTPTSAPTAGVPMPAPAPATVARFVSSVVPVYAQPGDARARFSLYDTTELGTPRVMLTTAVQPDWVQVLLPLRPNGSVGWVRTADVRLSTVPDRIDVDLATRTLTWRRDGQVLLSAPAAVGSAATPTPAGRFFVTDVLPWDPSDGRGSWVLALNGHSDAYATFEGGDARIAIHGTNDPSSIGNPVSNGCVRLAAEPLDELRSGVPVGTPVVVH